MPITRTTSRTMLAPRRQTNMLMAGLKSTFNPQTGYGVTTPGAGAPGSYQAANFPGGMPAGAFDPFARQQMGLPAWTGPQAMGYANQQGVSPEALMAAGGLGGMAAGPSPSPYGGQMIGMAPTGPRPQTGPPTMPGGIPQGADLLWDQMRQRQRAGTRLGANLPTRFK